MTRLHPDDLEFLMGLVVALTNALVGSGGTSGFGCTCCDRCLTEHCAPLVEARREEISGIPGG
jgi:hypothetical protein